jgi:hypothetical protein
MPLGHFHSTVNYKLGFHGYITAIVSFLSYIKVHALVSMVISAKDGMWHNHGNPTMLNISNPFLNKAEWCR